MSESGQTAASPIPWERIAVFIPIVAAAAFSCAGAQWVGFFIGMNRLGMLGLLSVSDVVNASIPFALIIAPIFSLGVWFGHQASQFIILVGTKRRQPKSIVPALFSLAFGIPSVTGVILALLKIIPWWGALALALLPVVIFLIFELWLTLRRWFPFKLLFACGASTVVMGYAFSLGAAGSYFQTIGKSSIIVHADSETYKSKVVVTVEKGVGILTPKGMVLIPWDQVKSVSYSEGE